VFPSDVADPDTLKAATAAARLVAEFLAFGGLGVLEGKDRAGDSWLESQSGDYGHEAERQVDMDDDEEFDEEDLDEEGPASQGTRQYY
jgi:hypothetical protein